MIRTNHCLVVFAALFLSGALCIAGAFKLRYLGPSPFEGDLRAVRGWANWVFDVGASLVFLSLVVFALAVAIAKRTLLAGEQSKLFDAQREVRRKEVEEQ